MRWVRVLHARFQQIGIVVSWVNRTVMVFFLGMLLLVVVSNVVLRYVFHSPFPWSDEVSKQVMIWMGFMGASLALWEKQHVGIDALVARLPDSLLPPIRLVGHLGVLYFLVFMLWFGVVLTKIAGPRQLIPTLRLPMTYVFIAVPSAAGLMILYQLTLILEDLIKTVALFSGSRKEDEKGA